MDSLYRKSVFNKRKKLSTKLHVCCSNKKVKLGDFRNETGQQPERNRAPTGQAKKSWQAASEHFGHYMLLRGHYKVTTFSFMNGSSSEPTRIILIAYAAWRSKFGLLRFEFSFMNGSSFEPILGSFWSGMLRGCVPDSVSLIQFHEWLISSRYSDHFGHVCCVVAFQIRFRHVSNLVS